MSEPNDPDIKLSEAMKKWRHTGRWVKQRELAEMTGLSRITISNIENRVQKVFLHQAVAIAKVINFDLGEL